MAAHSPEESELRISRSLSFAIVLSTGTFVMEVIGGWLSNSLALLSDSGHVFLDLFALGLSYYAVRLAIRPATDSATYGLHRAEVLASLINGLSLVVVSALIFLFAYNRLQDPPPVQGGIMLTIAAIGLVANVTVAIRIRGYDSLNVRSAYLHVIGDALSSVAVIVGGIVIQVYGVLWVDPFLSFLIGALIAFGAVRILVESANILLEKVPRHLAPERLVRELKDVDGVKEVHDLHVWSICSNCHAMSVHIVLDERADKMRESILKNITTHLRSSHGIEHTTIQMECENCGCDNG